MTEERKFGGVVVSAPLWRQTPQEQLAGIVKHLSDASYHFADDSTGEWSSGGKKLAEAAKAVNENKLGFSAITCLYLDKPQLVTLNEFVDAVLRDARKGDAP